LDNQIKSLELEKGGNFSTEKEQVYFKGGNDYFDNYPLSVTIEKETFKMINKLAKKFRF
jgi:hypothetical protein